MIKGKYILIEGGDGSGKSTQKNLLIKYLKEKNIEVIETREPGGTEISEIFRDIVLTPRKEDLTKQAELFSYLAARSQVTYHIIKPSLEKGIWVISDRGFPSTIAYQGFGLGINLELIEKLNKFAMNHDGLVNPDLTFIILGIDPQLGLKKATEKQADRQELRNLEFHKRVRQGYEYCLSLDLNAVAINYINNKPEEMHKQIIQKLKEKFYI